MNRPDWCPDPACEFRGRMEPVLCGGRTAAGGRLCLRFDKYIPVRSLDCMTDDELTELQRLLARLYGGAK